MAGGGGRLLVAVGPGMWAGTPALTQPNLLHGRLLLRGTLGRLLLRQVTTELPGR